MTQETLRHFNESCNHRIEMCFEKEAGIYDSTYNNEINTPCVMVVLIKCLYGPRLLPHLE